jgi:anti-sigma factor RsiW
LEAHPEYQANWELEAGINDALRGLPDAIVPSNFNARVMLGIERSEAAGSGRTRSRRIAWWRRFIPKLAVIVALLTAGLFSYEQVHTARVQEKARKAEVVQSFVTVSRKVELLEPEVLEHFDTIRQGADLVADEKLLTLLQ